MSFPTTIDQIIIAGAADQTNIEVGEFLTVNIDLAFPHDGSGARRWQAYLDRLGVGILAECDTYTPNTNRNSQGRMGDASANVYLASPGTVAIATVAGHIVRPSNMLGGS